MSGTGTSSDPTEALRAATRTIFHEQHAAMREIVRDLSDEALNWKPASHGDINSIAQMLSHALEAERFLMANTLDREVSRSREAQFKVTASAADMLAQIDQTEQSVDGDLDALTGAHLSAEVTRPTSRGPRARSGAWWLLHAVEHSYEHIGQASLTRQLFESQG
jgi:uncharacterized damage-inducible protein DinB